MDELTRFIAETPLWLSIPFFAVFAAMSIWHRVSNSFLIFSLKLITY